MMDTSGMLFARSIQAADGITMRLPTVGEILSSEQAYYGLVTLWCATPYEMMVQLDDLGMDFTKISEFELFCLLLPKIAEMDTAMLFPGFDLRGYQTARNRESGETVLWREQDGAIYNRKTHEAVCKALRTVHFMPKPKGQPGNEEARLFMIERMRAKQARAARKPYQSQLEGLIVSLICTEQYKYNFETTQELTIYQFNACLHQIVRKIQYDHLMTGCYAGMIDMKNLNQEDLSWFSRDIG